MITEIMQKVAADLDKKDAAIAGGLGLAGGGAGVGIGRTVAKPNYVKTPRTGSYLPGYMDHVYPYDYLLLKHHWDAVDRMIEKDPKHIKMKNTLKKVKSSSSDKLSHNKNYLREAAQELGDLLGFKKDLESKLYLEFGEHGDNIGKNPVNQKSERYKSLLKNLNDTNARIPECRAEYDKYLRRNELIEKGAKKGIAVLTNRLDAYDDALDDALYKKIQDKAQAWADYRNKNIIEPANQKLEAAEAKRVADFNEQAWKNARGKLGVRAGIAAGVLLPSVYLAYRKFSNK